MLSGFSFTNELAPEGVAKTQYKQPRLNGSNQQKILLQIWWKTLRIECLKVRDLKIHLMLFFELLT